MRALLRRCAESAAFHYAALLTLQAKVLWGVGSHRDLTTGDTSSYFDVAVDFSQHLSVPIHWSPLYTSFLGSLLWVDDDAYRVVTAHRVIIVVVTSLLVFELFRRLLPRPLAFGLAAWWILLPINHNTLYEVHLFSLAPLLATWIVLLAWPGPRGRGGAVALLAVTTVLVRNEFLLALGPFLLVALRRDLRCLWRARRPGAARRVALAYGVPAAGAAALILGFYARSSVKLPELEAGLQAKHRLNVSQIYAFGHGQRNPDDAKNPWTEYAGLMESTFGDDLPSMAEALAANPGALLEHFLWNASLVPSGLQVALFGVRAGRHNPDYAPTRREPALAWVSSALLLGVWLGGGWRMRGRDRAFWAERFRAQGWAWLAMGAVCGTIAVVMITQRPRPSYMFGLSVVSLALTGTALWAIVGPARARRARAEWGPLAVLAIVLLAPTYWASSPERPRRLLSYYRALEAERTRWEAGGVIAVPDYPNELASYLGRDRRPEVVALWALVGPEEADEATLQAALESAGVELALVDPSLTRSEAVQRFAARRFEPRSPASAAWQTLATGDEAPWVLLARRP